jgi:hypothetical protein
MEGKALLETLEKIKGGETYDIFNLLPEIAGGSLWLDEIKDTALYMQGYITESEDYDLDKLRDFGGEYANGQCEDYYSNINKRVQELSLWASNDIEEHLEGMGYEGGKSITDLNAQYLCSAMWIIWDAVADQLFQQAEQLEEVSA